MLETILATILVIGSVGAVAQGGTELQESKCVSKITQSVSDGEQVPALIEACYSPETLKQVLKCKTDECVRDVVDAE